MVEKIQKMFFMQKEFDIRVIKGDDYPIEKMKIALFVELGEALSEKEMVFKHWKQNHVNDDEKFLEELVDVFHFMLSIELYENYVYTSLFENDCIYEVSENMAEIYSKVFAEKGGFCLKDMLMPIYQENSFTCFFKILKEFGFCFEDLYNGYIKKNQINHKRQDNNY